MYETSPKLYVHEFGFRTCGDGLWKIRGVGVNCVQCPHSITAPNSTGRYYLLIWRVGGLQSSVQSVFCSQLLLSHPRDVFAKPIVSYLAQVLVSAHAPRQIGLKYRLMLTIKYYFYFRSVQQSWHRVKIELCLLICTNQFCNLHANDPQKIIFTYMRNCSYMYGIHINKAK
jgi:hypothetical protein